MNGQSWTPERVRRFAAHAAAKGQPSVEGATAFVERMIASHDALVDLREAVKAFLADPSDASRAKVEERLP